MSVEVTVITLKMPMVIVMLVPISPYIKPFITTGGGGRGWWGRGWRLEVNVDGTPLSSCQVLRSAPGGLVRGYLVNESDGAIDLHYAYLLALQRGVTTHTQACAVLGHKFADLRSRGRQERR